MSQEESGETDRPTEKLPSHHKKLEYCLTRKPYRKGRRSTAIKVFTVNGESQYLMVNNVHATGLHKDVVKLFSKYGNVTQCEDMKEYPKETFKDVFLVKFQDIQSARIAKRRTDEMYFYGSMLHVHYAPEYETPDETRAKLTQRRAAVVDRVRSLRKEESKLKLKDSGVKASLQTSSGDSKDFNGRKPHLKKTKEGTFANLQSSITLQKASASGTRSTESYSSVVSTLDDTCGVATAIRAQKEQIKKSLMEKMKPVLIRTPSYIPPHNTLPLGTTLGQNSAFTPSTFCTQSLREGTTGDGRHQNQGTTIAGETMVKSDVKKSNEGRKRNMNVVNGIVPRQKAMKLL